MKLQQTFMIAAFALGLGLSGSAQSGSITDPGLQAPGAPPMAPAPLISQSQTDAAPSPAVAMIEGFKDTDIKFDLNELLDILRDHRHEGWVLAAYPDPRTSQPLIGAGFSLDLPAREHSQPDLLNPHPFLEPSSAELWQAAGLDPYRLDNLLSVFYERRQEWSKRTWRRKLFSLPAQISDDDAMQLVRVGAIQAIYNAHAYCRNFDQMSGPQQMAMAQLVYQMGVNLAHFNEFLTTINPGPGASAAESAMLVEASQQMPATLDQSPEYWLTVQKSLMGSQWAHKYRSRAISVIAMLDPAYRDDPTAAEQRVGAVLRPAVMHRRHGRAMATRQVVAATTQRRHTRNARHSPRTHGRKRA